MRALVTLVWIAASAGVAGTHGYQELGTLEKQAVDDALALRGLILEPHRYPDVMRSTMHRRSRCYPLC
jgi:hypothetical protein